jgi:hypothetical protein
VSTTETEQRPSTIFLVWNDWDSEPNNGGYWEHFDSVADAVSTHGAGVEVYRAKPERLGKFKIQTKCVRIKARKKKVTA